MDSNYTVEELQSFDTDDLEAIRDLVKQLSDDAQELTNQDLQSIIESSQSHLYVIRDNKKKIVGMITLITYKIPYKMKGWIEDVVVDLDHRGKGLATTLLEYAITEAKKYHVKSLNLTSNPSREGANTLYVKLGFVRRDTNVYRMML